MDLDILEFGAGYLFLDDVVGGGSGYSRGGAGYLFLDDGVVGGSGYSRVLGGVPVSR